MSTGPTLGDETERLLDVLGKQITEDYAPPRVKRDAHPKMHGCVQAELTVEGYVPPRLRRGVFARPGKTFKAWIRFSNAFGIQHDLFFEPRGMAIKLLKVKGPRLESDERHTQDFLLATHDAFFMPDGTQYSEFAKASHAGPSEVFTFFRRRGLWRGFRQMLWSSFVLARNPLSIRYFSQTPYRLGDEQVKLQARPLWIGDLRRALPAAWWFAAEAVVANARLWVSQRPAAEQWCERYLESRDLLRRSMMDYLERHGAWFELLVQVGDRSPRMPIEDPTVRWPERLSPYERVATIHIPRQWFWPKTDLPDDVRKATIDMVDLGENMSFNPWHALVDHEPLGAINQMRRRIYSGIASLRHRLNGIGPVEPDTEQWKRFRSVVRADG